MTRAWLLSEPRQDVDTRISDPEGLPHGAKRLGFEGGTVVFLDDKVVFSPSGSPTHWTFHFGPRSGEIDLHATTGGGSTAVRERLFSMPHQQFGKLLIDVGLATLREMRTLIRPLRPGWMVRQRIGAVLGLVPTSDELEAVTTLRRRKLMIDPDKLAANVRVPTYVDELYQLGDGQSFTLIDWRRPRHPRRVGTGFKVTRDDEARLVWVRDRDMLPLLRKFEPVLLHAAKKYGTFHKPLPW